MNLDDGYLGRIVILGITPQGLAIAGYEFGGRSAGSKSREFKKYEDGKSIWFLSSRRSGVW